MATITDVARRAKVSVGTVSNYLNGTARVADATAERIREAIAALDYQVDLGARGLRAGHTRTVGLLLPNISNPFYAEIARAIERALSASGYQVLLCDSSDDVDREDAYLSNLVSRRVDGILMIYAKEREELTELAERLPVPVVFVDRGVPGVASVVTDNRLGGRLAARYLTDLGHRRIGLLIGEPEVRNVQDRIAGFQEELEAQGVPFDPSRVVHGPQALSFGHEISRLLRAPGPPTAVFATNDVVAIGAWQKLQELGLEVPRYLSIVGFDDIEMSRLIAPPLTTIAQDKQELGRRAVKLLVDLVEAGDVARRSERLTIAPRLVKRASSAAPREEDRFAGAADGEADSSGTVRR